MIAAGNLRWKVTIERSVGTLDVMGQASDNWGVLVKNRAAQKTPVRDVERIAAAQQGHAVTDRFLVRWEARLIDLGTADRLWLDRPGLPPLLYDIVGTKEVGFREGIEITGNARPDLATVRPANAPWIASATGVDEQSPRAGEPWIITIPWVVDGGGVPIQAGQKGHLHLDWPAILLGWTMLGDQVGSTTVDIWRSTFALFDPAVPHPGPADSITGGNPPRMVDAMKAVSNDLEGWSISLARGDVLAFNVPSDSTQTRVTMGLRLQRV